MTTLRIAHLASALLKQNGESGNIHVLRKRAAARGHTVEVVEVNDSSTPLDSIDLIFVGSGPVAALRRAMPLFQSLGETLRKHHAENVPLLAIAAGFQALGQQIRFSEGETVSGAGIFPVTTTIGGARIVGDFIVDTDLGRLVGFENRGAVIDIGSARPLGTVVYGQGNTPASRVEGVWLGNAIGTHLHGPVLANNPVLADWFLAQALQRRGEQLAPPPESLSTVDAYAAQARATIVSRPLSE